jgi:O-antigen/teichoic acid export membrane protein
MPLAPAIASGLWASPSEGALAVAMLVLVPIKSFQSSLANVQRLRNRAGLFAALSSVDLLAQLVFAIGFVAAGFGPTGLILGYAAGSFVGLIAAGSMSRDILRGPIRLRRAKAMVQAGLPFLPPVLAFLVADNVARILIAHYLGVGSVGDLGIALRAASAMSLVAGAFTLAWGPIGLGLSRTQDSSNLFGRMFSTYLTLSILAAIGLGALAPELTRFLGGPQFAGAAPAMPGLLFAAGMTGALFVLATAAGVHDRTHVVASSAILGAIVQVLASILLLPILGMPAVAVAAVIGRLVNLGILARAVRHVVEADWTSLAIVTLAGAGVVLGLQYVATLSESWIVLRWLIALAATLLSVRLVAQAVRVKVMSNPASAAS